MRLPVLVPFEPDHWTLQAVCASVDPAEWFPDAGPTSPAAKRICAACPVRVECLDAALEEEAGMSRKHRYGLRGGLTPSGRAKLDQSPRRGRSIA